MEPQIKHTFIFSHIIILHTYIHIYTYLHNYTHTYIHTIHTYIHTYNKCIIYTYLHNYIHTYIRTYVYTYIHTYIKALLLCIDLSCDCAVHVMWLLILMRVEFQLTHWEVVSALRCVSLSLLLHIIIVRTSTPPSIISHWGASRNLNWRWGESCKHGYKYTLR